MKRHIVAASILLAAGAALSAPLARNSAGDWVSLSQDPCPAEVLAVIPEAERSQYMAAKASVGGKQFAACWNAMPEIGAVHLYYSDGEQGLVSMRAFREDRDL
jgi:hypothetical protein